MGYMVGICGYTGNPSYTPMTEHVGTTSHASIQNYQVEGLELDLIQHPYLSDAQPGISNENAHIWMWGEVYGYKDDTGYQSLSEVDGNPSGIELCSELYEKYGKEFVKVLNGDFCGVLYDTNKDEIALFTDLLGSRPIYYIQNSGLSFSTSIYSISHIDDNINTGRINEYLLFSRILGTRTVFDSIKSIPPATIASFDPSTGELQDKNTYWSPTYKPIQKPYEEYVKEFSNIFSRAVHERTKEESDYGILLSGGSDSRIILSATDTISTSYHLNEEMNEEASVAKIVAKQSNSEFQFIKRSPNHYPTFLEDEIKLSNFNGAFTAAHTTGLGPRFRDEIDVLMSGHWSDTFFESKIPRWEIKMPTIQQTADIPWSSMDNSWNDIISLFSGSETELLDVSYGNPFRKVEIDTPLVPGVAQSPKQIVENGLSRDSSGVKFYNIKFRNFDDLVQYGYFYPLTNAWSYISHGLALQQIPYRNPFLDRRIIEMTTTMPMSYRLRRELIDDSIKNLDPNLASIRSSNTGISLRYSFFTKYILNYLNEVRSLVSGSEQGSFADSGSWPNHEEIIRDLGYVDDIINEAEHDDKLSEISFEKFNEIYQNHQNGDDFTNTIHTFLTLVTHPSLTNRKSSIEP